MIDRSFVADNQRERERIRSLVARLSDAVRRLANEGARFDAEAVDKACAEASKLGYSN